MSAPPRTILVTGMAGFIGSHTAVELLAAGHELIGVDNFDNSSPRALEAIEHLSGRGFAFYEADLRDRDAVGRIFEQHRVDSVIHFAGLKAVGESVADPMKYYRVNIGSTVSLIDAMASHGVHDLVFSSSCTVYGEPADDSPLTESAPLEPVNPYGRTKLLIEQMLRDVASADRRWRICLLRYFNPAGAHASGELGEDPRGVPNNLMPYVMQVAVGRREVLRIFGDDYPTRDGTCVRDFIHVTDLALGHLAALAALDPMGSGCHAVNLGTGTGTTVLEMVSATSEVIGRPVPFEMVGRRAGDACSVLADPTLANGLLSWRAERTIVDMCRDHWNWQASHPFGFRDVEPAVA